MIEEMEEVARAFHGGKLPPSPDEHEERRRICENCKRFTDSTILPLDDVGLKGTRFRGRGLNLLLDV